VRNVVGEIVECIAFEQIESGIDQRKTGTAAEQKAAFGLTPACIRGALQSVKSSRLRVHFHYI